MEDKMADNQDQQQNADNQDQQNQQQDWKQGIDESLRNHPSLEKFKDIKDVVKSYVEIQKLVGMDKLPLPKDLSKATPEEWATIFSRLGRPEKADGYKLPELQRPEGYPEPDLEETKALLNESHKLGLLPQQLAGLYEFFMKGEFAKFNKFTQDSEKERFDAETSLRREWGKAYEEKVSKAKALLVQYGGEEIKDFIEDWGNEPAFIKFLANIASKMSEDALGGKPVGIIKTPEEAKVEIAKIMGDSKHPYFDAQHPEHELAVKKMEDLHKQAYPENV